MNVCPNCFFDAELKALIKSSIIVGKCDFCKTEEESLLNIEELIDFFQELIDNFEVSSLGQSLRSKIQGDWNFFNGQNTGTIILNYVLPRLNTKISDSESLVEYSQEITDNVSYWDKFKEELKWKNRFLFNIEHLTQDLGWDSFFNTQFTLPNTVLLYRGRVHHESGSSKYSLDKMGCPPAKHANAGRANPTGIPYLYLSDNPNTVLYEVRASFLDELSIGSFKLNDSKRFIKIVDFTEETSLFQPNYIAETIKAKLLRMRISADLSKPMRRYDSEIEYLPTQFICEFIRVFTGASGIRYNSSLDPTGKNFVIFDQSILKCIEVEIHKVNQVELKSIKVS